MKMRRLLCLVSCAILLAGCGKDVPLVEEQETEVETVEETEGEMAVESAVEPESTSIVLERIGGVIHLDEENSVDPETVYGTMRDISVVDLIDEIGAGWNLGNTFDARGGETAWGNPRVTPELIAELADKGFNCIRIPVTWFQYAGEAPDYKIDADWLKRVEQVVDYALEKDMYVIINTHHETDWLVPDKKNAEAVEEVFVALWKQIAEYFKPYGDHLIFEGMNEPRVVGGANEWGGGTAEGREIIDQLNQAFVDTVRATGGNNTERCLMLTSYAAASSSTALENIAIPEDDHIAFSIHAYVPYDFTYSSDNSYSVWNGEDHPNAILPLFQRLEKYLLSKGVPVIITEFGAVSKKLESGEVNDGEVEKWLTEYMGYAAEYDVPCIWWDNGQCYSGNELFAIYDRNKMTWFRGSLADVMVGAAEGRRAE